MSSNLEDDPEFHDAAPKPNPRRGFRLIDLLVVVAILALLIALLLPATRSAPHASRRVQCTNNMKHIALALENYEREYKAFPPAYTVDANGRPLHSWRTLLLPYLEQDALYRTIDLTKPWNDPVNAEARETAVLVFRCPEAGRPKNMTTYLAVTGSKHFLMHGRSRHLDEITDGRGSTLTFIDASEDDAVPWMAPRDADESMVLRFGSHGELHHAGGTNMALVDGSVRFVKTNISPSVLRALVTISGGEQRNVDEY